MAHNNRQNAAPLLAGALGDELLGPGAERAEAVGGDPRELPPALVCRAPEQKRQLDGGVAVAQARESPPAAIQQLLGRKPEPHRREHPHDRERRVAAAHVHGVVEHGAEPALLREARQRRSWLGHRDETPPSALAKAGTHGLPENLQQRGGLGGGARLAHRYNGGARRVQGPDHLRDALGVGGVHDHQLAA